MIEHSETTILLVEDDQADAELALNVLHKLLSSGNVRVAKDGLEALDYIFPKVVSSEHRIPRVIFLDLKLPRVDGFEVLRRIKSDERTKMIPVVIFSSSRELKDILKSFDLGANSYVVKPVNAELYERTVSTLGNYWLTMNENPEYNITDFLETARPG